MELKKSKKADLENKRGLFLNIGMFVALGIVLFAFTYTERVTKAESLGQVAASEINEEMIPITRQEEAKPPPPPPSPAAVEILNIVNDETKITDNLEIMDSEATKDTKVEVAVVQITTEEEEKVEEDIFVVVENMPEFPGGDLALLKYIANSIQYPTIAQENGIQGRVLVNFVVDKDGSISNAKIARGVDPAIDKEALRVIMSLPKWKPGLQRGKPVRVSYTVPISFQLQ